MPGRQCEDDDVSTVEDSRLEVTRQVKRVAPATSSLRMALIVTRREVRDSFRDWRIIIPILLLTLFFPLLMNFTAGRLLDFVTGFGAEIIGTRLIPFLLLVVGFFPTSFSLVIALETFVGEKERSSLEPLLATPLTNAQIYVGKMLASMIPPLSASYLGIVVYLVGLWLTIGWQASWQLLAQTFILTTVQAVVMVAAAVIVSSQTTTTRAANLLASFIIVPMALLVQFEAIVMFWGNHDGLWWLILALVAVAAILIRMGIHVFDREELLGRDLDHIRVGWALRTFWKQFSGRGDDGYPGPIRWYRQTLSLIAQLRQPFLAVTGGFVGAIVLGLFLADRFSFSQETQTYLREANLAANLAQLEGVLSGLPTLLFVHNLRVVIIAIILGAFTFGVLAIGVFMLPWTLLTFVAAQLQSAGGSAVAFLLATVAPHGVVELPVLLLLAAAALRWQTAVIAPGQGRSLSEAWITGSADFFRLFVGIGVPLLLLAAFLEAYVTPIAVRLIYG